MRPQMHRHRRDQQSGMTLVELLVGMTIMSVITAMVLVTWFALSRSYSFSATSSMARDNAREATARLVREVRDAESNPATSEAALIRARVRTVVVSTTFNMSGNASPSKVPHLVMYRYYPDGELWRFYDKNGNGSIENVDMSVDGWPANPNPVAEQVNGEGGRMLVKDVVNDKVPSVANPTPLFRYSYYRDDGVLVQDTTVIGAANRRRVVSVQLNLLVDLNPAHSPIYSEFLTTAQLRNQQ
jgi:prepilin-type N-terminal cleavage/methylation domain-containing protein